MKKSVMSVDVAFIKPAIDHDEGSITSYSLPLDSYILRPRPLFSPSSVLQHCDMGVSLRSIDVGSVFAITNYKK